MLQQEETTMKNWMQRVRGAIGIGATWAAGWAPIGAVAGWVTAMLVDFPPGVVAANYAAMFGVLGLVGGTIFSTVLRLAEGHRSFEQLSLPRFVGWGALGGLVLGGLAVSISLLGAGFTTFGAVIVGATTLLGAGSAAGTLVVARAADERALLGDGGSGTNASLAGAKARRLPR
jgi:hypothetical protein